MEFIVEHWETIAPVAFALAIIALRLMARNENLAEIAGVIENLIVQARIGHADKTVVEIAGVILPAEIARRTELTVEQAHAVIRIGDDGRPEIDRAGLVAELRKSGDWKKIQRKFRKWRDKRF